MPWLSRSIINKSFTKFITCKKYEIYNTIEQSRQVAAVMENLTDPDANEAANILTGLSNACANQVTSNQRKEGQPKDTTMKKKNSLILPRLLLLMK